MREHGGRHRPQGAGRSTPVMTIVSGLMTCLGAGLVVMAWLPERADESRPTVVERQGPAVHAPQSAVAPMPELLLPPAPVPPEAPAPEAVPPADPGVVDQESATTAPAADHVHTAPLQAPVHTPPEAPVEPEPPAALPPPSSCVLLCGFTL